MICESLCEELEQAMCNQVKNPAFMNLATYSTPFFQQYIYEPITIGS